MSTEEESREEIEEALGHLSHTASRCFRVVGNEQWVTPWDKTHNQINDLLDARDRVAVPA
jgi:hypothetical protein